MRTWLRVGSRFLLLLLIGGEVDGGFSSILDGYALAKAGERRLEVVVNVTKELYGGFAARGFDTVEEVHHLELTAEGLTNFLKDTEVLHHDVAVAIECCDGVLSVGGSLNRLISLLVAGIEGTISFLVGTHQARPI